MGELRREPVLGQWIIVSNKEESLAPGDYPKENNAAHNQAICQFCPGKEDHTPPEVDAVRFNHSKPNTSDWNVRVIPNKFPALKIEGDLRKRGYGIYDLSNGVGAHEVLIETRDHNRQMADLSPQEISDVLQMCQNRSISLAKDKRFKYIMFFKNFGESAGASVEHSHSQIIALPMVPKTVLAELESARSYHAFRGRCVFCDMIEQEIGDEERIVKENEHFMAFSPFVPRYPFEVWILPKEHDSEFCTFSIDQRLALADILKAVLQDIKICLSNPSYNFYLHVPPINYPDQETYHWHIEIIPKLTSEKGYEWGTGLYAVGTEPSVAAKYLREAHQ